MNQSETSRNCFLIICHLWGKGNFAAVGTIVLAWRRHRCFPMKYSGRSCTGSTRPMFLEWNKFPGWFARIFCQQLSGAQSHSSFDASKQRSSKGIHADVSIPFKRRKCMALCNIDALLLLHVAFATLLLSMLSLEKYQEMRR